MFVVPILLLLNNTGLFSLLKTILSVKYMTEVTMTQDKFNRSTKGLNM